MRPYLGTFVEIQLIGDRSEHDFEIIAHQAFSAIEKVHRLMSFHLATSDLSRLNDSPVGRWINIDPWTALVLRKSLSLQKLSRGRFNVAIADVLIRNGTLPGKKRRSLSAGADAPPAFEVRKNRARRTNSCRIDLGGIAKGFAVDRAVECIQRTFKSSGVVNAGGDLRGFGPRSSKVYIREGRSGFSGKVLKISNRAVATSDSGPDKVTHHRKTLRPGRTISVIASNCMTADGLTKIALMGETQIVEQCLRRYRAELI